MKAYFHKTKGIKQVFPVPEDLENWEVVEVECASQLHTHIASEGVLALDLSVLEDRIRSERNTKIKEADYLVNKAIDIQDAEGERLARAYRQALRDVPDQEGFPHRIYWPVKPT